MRLKNLIATMSLLLLCSTAANATLFLSGDGNIINGLSSTAGNRQFFTNILQGGNTVSVSTNGGYGSWGSDVVNFYNGITGVSASYNGSITSSSLSGVDLLISILPNRAYSTTELSAMRNFLSGGGSIFLFGENSNFPGENSIINSTLAALDSRMSIKPGSLFDSGYWTATGSQIAADSFTAGVTEFLYAAPSELAVVGGTSLFYGSAGQAFVAYEGAPVPEPSTMVLVGAGVVGLGFWRRRNRV